MGKKVIERGHEYEIRRITIKATPHDWEKWEEDAGGNVLGQWFRGTVNQAMRYRNLRRQESYTQEVTRLMDAKLPPEKFEESRQQLRKMYSQ